MFWAGTFTRITNNSSSYWLTSNLKSHLQSVPPPTHRILEDLLCMAWNWPDSFNLQCVISANFNEESVEMLTTLKIWLFVIYPAFQNGNNVSIISSNFNLFS
uniref:Uncharacterized protein n=1 Tax=Octopus bimaculoides TaxID=37653 RepID=A0A0L8G080_OCTBM